MTPLQYIVTGVLLLVFDLFWITTNKPLYGKMVHAIQKKDMVVNVIPAIIAYVLMYASIVFLVIPYVEHTKDKSFQNSKSLMPKFKSSKKTECLLKTSRIFKEMREM